jgi:hypothetical protein
MLQGTKTDTFNGVINVAGALYMSVLFLVSERKRGGGGVPVKGPRGWVGIPGIQI